MIRWPRRLLAAICGVFLAAAAARAQGPATIAGVVRGGGLPLHSAAVSLPDLGLGTYTDPQGQYRLIVPGGRYRPEHPVRVTVHLLGYDSAVATVTLLPDRVAQQDFTLALDPLRLAEIVATGVGTRTQALRLGTVRAFADSTLLQQAGQVNVLRALAGRIAGAVTMQQGGEPGSSVSLRIRGVKTTSNSGQPLLVVDGIPLNNETRAISSALAGGASLNRGADLDPDDIESIEVLKGPAAAAIYGSSAGSGGVLLITTKHGRPGPAAFTYHTSLTLDRPSRYLPLQRSWGFGSGGVAQPCAAPDCQLTANSWGPLLPAGTATYDHSRELFTTGRLLDNTLSVSGGDDRSTYYLSLGATGQNGFIVGNNDTYRRYSARLNARHQLSSALTIGGSAAYVQTSDAYVLRGNTTSGFVLDGLRTPPDFNNLPYLDPVTGMQRSYRFPNPSGASAKAPRGLDNPFFVVNEDRSTSSVGRILGNVNATWMAQPWLSVAYTLGVDQANDDRVQGLALSSTAASTGQVDVQQLNDRILDHTLTATATHAFSNDLEGSLIAGQNLRQTDFRVLYVIGRGLAAPQPFNLSNTSTRDVSLDRSSRVRLAGYLLQGSLGLRDELFLSAGVRNDAASVFAPGHQSAWYPRASAAWSFSRRLRLPPGLLRFGKLRLAYGQSGQLPAPYLLQDALNDPTTPFNDAGGGSQLPNVGGIPGLYTGSSLGNPNLHPERNGELETGVDLSLLDGRVDASLTYYLQDARGLILSNLSLAPSSGAAFTTRNAARVTNKGLEATANLRLLARPALGLDVGLNWALNRNHVVSFDDPNLSSVVFWNGVTVTPSVQPGYAMGVLKGNDFARCGRGIGVIGSDSVAAACGGAPDGALYIGRSGLPILDPTSRVIGSPDPDWTGGLTADLRMRGVHVSALLEHRQGGVVFNGTRASLRAYGTSIDTDIRGQQRTFGVDYMPGATVGPGRGQAVTLDQSWFAGLGGISGPPAQFLEDATFTRLSALSISGTVRSAQLRALGLSSVDVRLSGQNLAIWTKYTGFDPEPSLGGAVIGNRGIDYFGTPLSRGLQLSLSLHH